MPSAPNARPPARPGRFFSSSSSVASSSFILTHFLCIETAPDQGRREGRGVRERRNGATCDREEREETDLAGAGHGAGRCDPNSSKRLTPCSL